MKRRAFVTSAVAGSVLGTGCLGLGGTATSGVERSITVTEQGCGERENSGTLTYDTDSNTLDVTGVLSGTQKCGPLNLAYARSANDEIVIVDIQPTPTDECSSCTQYFEYDAQLTFSTAPSVIKVVHTDPEIIAGIGMVTTGQTTTSSQ